MKSSPPMCPTNPCSAHIPFNIVQDLRENADHTIAVVITIAIVEFLEVIQVRVAHRKRCVLMQTPSDFRLDVHRAWQSRRGCTYTSRSERRSSTSILARDSPADNRSLSTSSAPAANAASSARSVWPHRNSAGMIPVNESLFMRRHAQGVLGDLGQRAGHLDSRRAAADDRERQPRGARGAVLAALGALERADDPRAQRQRVGERLQPRRVPGPVVVAEVAVGRAGGDDQVVVGQDRAAVRRRRRGRRCAPRRRSTSTSPRRMVRLPRRISLRSTWRIGALTAGALSPAVATW